MRAHITVGLGYGDEGKGATVDFLCRQLKAKLVVRYSGGAQAGHNVVLPNGHRHTFSQFGAGTFAGAGTYLAPAVIIDPLAMKREAAALVKAGIYGPFSRLTVHPHCLIATPLHRAVNRHRERQRQDKHGSCGMGIGEARSYWLRHGSDAPRAADFHSTSTLRDKLELLRQRTLLEFPMLAGVLTFSASEYILALPQLTIDDEPLSCSEDVVFEGAQGILIDENYGQHPYTTWGDVTPRHAVELCEALGWSVESVYGCIRAYMTRHGNGPFATEEKLKIFDEGNPYNEWQGSIRFGSLDIPLLKRSCEAARESGGEISGLSVSCLDHASWGADVSLNALRMIAPVAITADGPTWEHRHQIIQGSLLDCEAQP